MIVIGVDNTANANQHPYSKLLKEISWDNRGRIGEMVNGK